MIIFSQAFRADVCPGDASCCVVGDGAGSLLPQKHENCVQPIRAAASLEHGKIATGYSEWGLPWRRELAGTSCAAVSLSDLGLAHPLPGLCQPLWSHC